jgi:Tfp pilus assembly protein FimT
MFVSWHRNLGKNLAQPADGFTLMEATAVVVVMGVLTALGAPLLTGFNKPLQNATNQMEGVFRQVRMRAISTTTAQRVRYISPTQIVVEASTTRGCEASTQLTIAANATDTQLTVASTRGFVAGDRITVGTQTNLNVVAVDEGLQRITLGAPLGAAQAIDTSIELTNNWRPGALATSITEEDLTLRPGQGSQGNIQFDGATPNWTLCFDSRGHASLFNPRTGRPINGNLTLSLVRTADGGSTPIPGSATGQVTVFQGGGVTSNARVLNE